jgi:hypothetical protein
MAGSCRDVGCQLLTECRAPRAFLWAFAWRPARRGPGAGGRVPTPTTGAAHHRAVRRGFPSPEQTRFERLVERKLRWRQSTPGWGGRDQRARLALSADVRRASPKPSQSTHTCRSFRSSRNSRSCPLRDLLVGSEPAELGVGSGHSHRILRELRDCFGNAGTAVRNSWIPLKNSGDSAGRATLGKRRRARGDG